MRRQERYCRRRRSSVAGLRYACTTCRSGKNFLWTRIDVSKYSLFSPHCRYQASRGVDKRLREHTSLRDSKEEASSEETGVVLHKSLADGDEAEGEHAGGEPDVRFQLFEKDV